ncbi:hypothetical protein SAMN04489740_2724 [Arthrobacter alpinus]|uniref:Uncharacterized protein n=1 Tax=Arthrobacter alpinus TaxID=656366 RepID=A0A1H5M4Z2_9MICC|nr:hypothetical protein [Arthrobacter alpinus]SEE83578.1 hypothetical protein SAMN04489740_2724 [Arthrobacter alpinus]
MADIGDTVDPKSDQQSFDDYQTGPRTVTVTGVKVIKGDQQPVHIELAEYPGRPFKPNKSMRRVLIKAWGDKSAAYVGRALTLFGNPTVTYGGKTLGGVEISHLSHIGKALTLQLTATRGNRKPFTVKPLAEPGQRDWAAEIAAADIDGLKQLWGQAPQNLQADIETRAAQLKEAN